MKKKNEITIRSSAAEYLTFIAATGDDKEAIEVRYEDENIWLTQKMLSTLYNVEINTINYHIKKIYNDSELTEDSTIRKFRIVQKEGNREVSRDVIHYNLQMIIALGFKVDNERAIQFRKWANEIVKEYTIKGFAMINEYLQKFKEGHSIAEYLVIPKYRRNKIGKKVAFEIFDKYPGNWEIRPSYNSEKAYLFWKRTIEEYTKNNCKFEDGIFLFNNKNLIK